MARDYVEVIHASLLPCRTPGANRTVTAWRDGTYPVSWNPPHRPVLPPEFAAAGGQPAVDPRGH